MLPKLIRAPRKITIRRAVFVCDHPDLGLVFIDRSVFQRRWGPNLDECKTKGVLIDQARKALRSLFGGEGMEVQRVTMVPMYPQKGVTVEQTVFRVSTIFGGLFKNVSNEHFISVDDHELGAEVRRVFSIDPPKEKIRGLG